ncbi:hypothetical protein GEMRC1_011233 [Eukaryota sp. GEM-RC1]
MDFSSAYRSKIEPSTGGYLQVFEQLKGSIRGYIRRNSAKHWFVGITSGGANGLRTRWNGKYKALGYTHIICVYSTGSQAFSKNLEAKLVEHFNHYDSLDNKRGRRSWKANGKWPVFRVFGLSIVLTCLSTIVVLFKQYDLLDLS